MRSGWNNVDGFGIFKVFCKKNMHVADCLLNCLQHSAFIMKATIDIFVEKLKTKQQKQNNNNKIKTFYKCHQDSS